MRIVADENFPRPSIERLRKAGWDVLSIAEKCPGISDEEVASLCAEEQRILLTFDKDFGELAFRSRLPASSGVVFFRITPVGRFCNGRHAIRAARRYERGLCPACGYCLAGNASGVCPECGLHVLGARP